MRTRTKPRPQRPRLHATVDRLADAAAVLRRSTSRHERAKAHRAVWEQAWALQLLVNLDVLTGAWLQGALWGTHLSMCRGLGKMFGDDADDAFAVGLREALECVAPHIMRAARAKRAAVRAAAGRALRRDADRARADSATRTRPSPR